MYCFQIWNLHNSWLLGVKFDEYPVFCNHYDSSPDKFKILISEVGIKTNGSKVSILMIVHYSNITLGKPLTKGRRHN